MTGGERHPRDPFAVVVDHSLRVGDLGRDLVAHLAAELRCDRDLARGCGRHEGVAVDLSVRMMDRRAHRGASVLEHQHVFDLVAREQRFGALDPQVDDAHDRVDPDRRERRHVIGREQHDFGRPARRGRQHAVARNREIDRRARTQRRPAVLERAHDVRVGRFEPTDTERAARVGKVRPTLAMGNHEHPLAGEPVETQLVRTGVGEGRIRLRRLVVTRFHRVILPR